MSNADIECSRKDGVVTLELLHDQGHNAFSRQRIRNLRDLVRELTGDPDVRAMVLVPADGRSFSVGGDFHETSELVGGSDIEPWIDEIANLYVALLSVHCPVVVAIDGYAIGLGLQIALTADWRIGTSGCALMMPEFKIGIACSFGGYMLERCVGRAVMQAMVYSGDPWPAERALADGLLHEVTPPEDLARVAHERAMRLAALPEIPVQATKRQLNAEYITGLEAVRETAKQAHGACFRAGVPQDRMRSVIGLAART